MEIDQRRPSMPAIFNDRTQSHHTQFKGRFHKEQLKNEKRKHIFGEHYNYDYHYHKPIVSGRQRIQQNRSLQIEKSNLKLLQKIQTIFKRTSITRKHKLQPISTQANIVNTSRLNTNTTMKISMPQRKSSISKAHDHQSRSISSIQYQSTPNHNALEILKNQSSLTKRQKSYDVKKNKQLNLRLKEVSENGDKFKRCQTQMYNKSYTYRAKQQCPPLNKLQSPSSHLVNQSHEQNFNKKQSPNPQVPIGLSLCRNQVPDSATKAQNKLNSNIISIQIVGQIDKSQKKCVTVAIGESLQDEQYSMQFQSCESLKQQKE